MSPTSKWLIKLHVLVFICHMAITTLEIKEVFHNERKQKEVIMETTYNRNVAGLNIGELVVGSEGSTAKIE
jgi:hypothetical protein